MSLPYSPSYIHCVQNEDSNIKRFTSLPSRYSSQIALSLNQNTPLFVAKANVQEIY